MDSEGTTYRETIGEVTLGCNIAKSSEPRNRIICNFKGFGTTCVGELAKSDSVVVRGRVTTGTLRSACPGNLLSSAIDLHVSIGVSGVSHLVGPVVVCGCPVDIGVVAVPAEGPDYSICQWSFDGRITIGSISPGLITGLSRIVDSGNILGSYVLGTGVVSSGVIS